MSDRDPRFAAGGGPQQVPFSAQSFEEDERLGRLEWEVVEIARVDGPRGSDPNSLGMLLLRKLFAIATVRPLASERLEQLRRFAVKAWYRNCVRERDMSRLLEAGFSSNDAWRVLAHIAVRRGRMPEIEAWPG